MAKSKAGDLWHVILTPQGGQGCEPLDMKSGRLDGADLEVCHIEPVGQERAQELIELLAKMSTGGRGACHPHDAGTAPCPICSPVQRDHVAHAVRRALRDDP